MRFTIYDFLGGDTCRQDAGAPATNWRAKPVYPTDEHGDTRTGKDASQGRDRRTATRPGYVLLWRRIVGWTNMLKNKPLRLGFIYKSGDATAAGQGGAVCKSLAPLVAML